SGDRSRIHARYHLGTGSKRRRRQTGPRLHQHRTRAGGLRHGLVPLADNRDSHGSDVRTDAVWLLSRDWTRTIEAQMKHREVHRGNRIGWLRAAVLGANDGIV